MLQTETSCIVEDVLDAGHLKLYVSWKTIATTMITMMTMTMTMTMTMMVMVMVVMMMMMMMTTIMMVMIMIMVCVNALP